MTDLDPEMTVTIQKGDDPDDIGKDSTGNEAGEQNVTPEELSTPEQQDQPDQDTPPAGGDETPEEDKDTEQTPEDTSGDGSADESEPTDNDTTVEEDHTLDQDAAEARGPRSPKFNIYETDMLATGASPFTEGFIEMFSFLGKNFGAMCRAVNNAAFGLFSKPISSCKALAETLYSIGNKTSAVLTGVMDKYKDNRTELGIKVGHTNAQDHAAGQMAIMNTFLDDISQVGQKDLDALVKSLGCLTRLRDGEVDLNGVKFYGVDENGNAVTGESLGLKELVMYLNGDPTCGGAYSDVKASEDEGRTRTNLTDSHKRQLKSYVNEYNLINNELRAQIKIRDRDIYSEQKYAEYEKLLREQKHKEWIADRDNSEIALSDGTVYQATRAQALAREMGVLGEDGKLNKDMLASLKGSSKRKEVMDAVNSILMSEPSLPESEVNQLRALRHICELSSWVMNRYGRKTNKLEEEKKRNAILDKFQEYLSDGAVHASLGLKGIDVSDQDNSRYSVFDYSDLPTNRRITWELEEEVQFNPGIAEYDQRTHDILKVSPGAVIADDSGQSLVPYGFRIAGGSTYMDILNSRDTVNQTRNYNPECAIDRANQTAYDIARNTVLRDGRYAPYAKALGAEQDSAAGRRWERLFANPVLFAETDPEKEFVVPLNKKGTLDLSQIDSNVYLNAFANSFQISTKEFGFNDPDGVPYPDRVSLYKLYNDLRVAKANGESGKDLAMTIQTKLDPLMIGITTRMQASAERVKEVYKEVADKIKSPLVIARMTEVEKAINMITASAVPSDVTDRVLTAYQNYLGSSDEQGHHLSPGCSMEGATDIDGQLCQMVIDPKTNKTVCVPVYPSYGSKDAYMDLVDAIEKSYEYLVGGNLLPPEEKKRLMLRLTHYVSDETILSADNTVAMKVLQLTRFDPMNSNTLETRTEFRNYCSDTNKLGNLSRIVRDNCPEPPVDLNSNVQNVPQFIAYRDNRVASMVTSVDAIFAQFDKFWSNDRDKRETYLGDYIRQIIHATDANGQPLLTEKQLNDLNNLIPNILDEHFSYSTDDINEAIISRLQYLGSIEIKNKRDAEMIYDDLTSAFHILNTVFYNANRMAAADSYMQTYNSRPRSESVLRYKPLSNNGGLMIFTDPPSLKMSVIVKE